VAIAYRGQAANHSTVSQPNNVTLPAGVQAGDVMLAFVSYSNSSTMTNPSGWTEHSERVQSSLTLSLINISEPTSPY